ncbi:2',3'-cyclic-nucleotide 2'-phosphodiesterase (5'-nucleotidase family) [Caldalkalibacillus uzonensis]|uniref:2',3'-cyclic-nucleotide 2'-phosphodiesterase (5'-nucleotidase family) n=1 Tax=Caldalkalibacillus uzonensis TaxID=353224 RepID=A0ABU0CQT9_9BACI|nr:5'-nucleotidase C-terminal domain-containing protein [Caldalkalibacillus uzonensis]MDQ0338771.1 2',3'-cyclic-nucleotide 2'-phosphodiesterase (5'-nucleotidase family) [Caldalkalibacillus uzonensis]
MFNKTRLTMRAVVLCVLLSVMITGLGFGAGVAEGAGAAQTDSERTITAEHNSLSGSKPVSKATFLKALVETIGVQLYDVSAADMEWEHIDDEFAPYVEAALRLQWLDEEQVKDFHPRQHISRQEACHIYVQALNLASAYDDQALTQFRDHRAVSEWAKQSMAAAYELEVLTVKKGHTLQPKAPLSKQDLDHMLRHYEQLDKVNIIHMNDLHGRVLGDPEKGEMGLSKIATLINRAREQHEHVFVFDMGDTFHGTNYVNFNQGMAAVEVMNEIGFDAMVPGNHDFNYGLDRFKAFAELVDFPLISANIVQNGEPILEPYVILETMGKTFAIVGLTSTDTPITTHPDNVKGIEFQDEVETAQNYVDKLKDEVDHIIFITHAGLAVDQRIAEEVEGIDLIVGGHSHSTLHTPQFIGDTYVTQAYEYGKHLGSTTMLFHNGRLIGINGYLWQDSADIAQDPHVQDILERYKQKADEALQEVIGYTDRYLDGARESVRTKETNLGNLIADAMRDMVSADIALQNGGGIRASLGPGEITLGDVMEVLPFQNTVVKLLITGGQLEQVLEHSVSRYPDQHGGFLQVSGLNFTFDPSQPPGSRVQDVWINGEPLQYDRTYSVATNDFLGSGGDGYTWLAEGELVADTGELLSTALMQYLHQEPDIPDVEGRIVVIP